MTALLQLTFLPNCGRFSWTLEIRESNKWEIAAAIATFAGANFMGGCRSTRLQRLIPIPAAAGSLTAAIVSSSILARPPCHLLLTTSPLWWHTPADLALKPHCRGTLVLIFTAVPLLKRTISWASVNKLSLSPNKETSTEILYDHMMCT